MVAKHIEGRANNFKKPTNISRSTFISQWIIFTRSIWGEWDIKLEHNEQVTLLHLLHLKASNGLSSIIRLHRHYWLRVSLISTPSSQLCWCRRCLEGCKGHLLIAWCRPRDYGPRDDRDVVVRHTTGLHDDTLTACRNTTQLILIYLDQSFEVWKRI